MAHLAARKPYKLFKHLFNFLQVSSDTQSMRWEEAVKVALCYGWIDSTVKRLDNERRKQHFTPRKPKSVWSKLNKTYIKQLAKDNLIHTAGLKSIEIGKTNGSWDSLNDIDNEVIPADLQKVFDANHNAFENYKTLQLLIEKAICIGYTMQKEKLLVKNGLLKLYNYVLLIKNRKMGVGEL